MIGFLSGSMFYKKINTCGKFIINTENPLKDFYNIEINDLNKIHIKKSIILDVVISQK